MKTFRVTRSRQPLNDHPLSNLGFEPLSKVEFGSAHEGRVHALASKDRLERKAQVDLATQVIAQKLMAAGLECHQRATPMASFDVLGGGCPKMLEPKFRNLMILPAVRQREIAPTVTALKAYIVDRGITPTMWTFGHGYVPVSDWRDRVHSLTKEISDLKRAAAKAGVDFIATNIETAHFYVGGNIQHHVHCHAIVDRTIIKLRTYNKFLERWKKKLGYLHAEEYSGPNGINALVDYVFKPVDKASDRSTNSKKLDITDLPPGELLAYAHASMGVKLRAIHGGFKLWARQFKAKFTPCLFLPDAFPNGPGVKIPIIDIPKTDPELESLYDEAFREAVRYYEYVADESRRYELAQDMLARAYFLKNGICIRPRHQLALVFASDSKTSILKSLPCESRSKSRSAANAHSGPISDFVVYVKSGRALIINPSGRSFEEIARLPQNSKWVSVIDDYRAISNAAVPMTGRIPAINIALATRPGYMLKTDEHGIQYLISLDARAIYIAVHNQGNI